MRNNILLVEDNEFKREKIIEHIKSINPNCNIVVTLSFTSAWQTIIKHEFDIIILDMSLPSFDISETENGGDFRDLGGKEIAQRMKKRKIKTPFIFLTHYRNFSDNLNTYSFDSLKKELLTTYPEQCLDFIFFNSQDSNWRQQVKKIIC